MKSNTRLQEELIGEKKRAMRIEEGQHLNIKKLFQSGIFDSTQEGFNGDTIMKAVKVLVEESMVSFKAFQDLKHNTNMMDVTKILTNTVKGQAVELEALTQKNEDLCKKYEELEVLVEGYAKKKNSIIECLGHISLNKSIPETIRDKINYLLGYVKDEIDNVSGLTSFENDFDISMVDGIGNESFMQPALEMGSLDNDEDDYSLQVDDEQVDDLKSEIHSIKKTLKNYLKKFEEFEDMERFENIKKNRVKLTANKSESNYSNSAYDSESKYSSKRSSTNIQDRSETDNNTVYSKSSNKKSTSREGSSKKKPSFIKRSVHNSGSLSWMLQTNSIFTKINQFSSPKPRSGSSRKQ